MHMTFDGGGKEFGRVTHIKETAIGFEVFAKTDRGEELGSGFKVESIQRRRALIRFVRKAIEDGHMRLAHLPESIGLPTKHFNCPCMVVPITERSGI